MKSHAVAWGKHRIRLVAGRKIFGQKPKPTSHRFLLDMVDSYWEEDVVLCCAEKEVSDMAKRRANGDVCERCQWQIKRAKRSGSNKEYREVNNDRYDYVATGEGNKS